jgi:hypothetical protein
MNIKQALKKKNKLVGLISEEFAKAARYNSIDEGNIRPYSATESLKKYIELTDELIELKAQIHRANAPVYDSIFRLAELKSQAKQLKGLDCTSGTISSRWDKESSTIKHAEITILERDGMVKEIEVRIEILQDQLDHHNHITEL